MEIILTILTGLSTVVAAYFAWNARRFAHDAHEQAWKIRKSAGAIEILRDDADALTKRINKLAGRFYRNLQDEPEPAPESAVGGEGTYAEPAPRDPRTGICYDICPNWTAARADGPGSAAAMCDCDYCSAARKARHDAKAALVPKSNADRIASMRKGLAT